MKKIVLLLHICIPICLLFLESCTYETLSLYENCEDEGVQINSVDIEDSECGLQVGSVTLYVSGGKGKYHFKINDEPAQEESIYTNLAAGTYTIIVTAGNRCQASVEILIKNKNGVNIEATATEAGCQTNSSTLTVQAVGGEAPYEYTISDGRFQSNNIFTELASGYYTITVKDATGCEAQQRFHIKSGILFLQTIAPIIETKCAINDCHNGNQFPDYRQFKNVREHAAQIKELTGDRTMPEEGSLTQEQIDAISCWVDDGAVLN